MTEITPRGMSPGRRPEPLSPQLTALMARATLTETGGLPAIAEARAPSPAERELLADRREQLTRALAPYADEARVQSRVVALRLVMPSTTGGESLEDRAMTLRLYAHALMRFPEWVVGEACARFIDGRAGSGRFAPTPAELAAECDAVAAPLHQEHYRLSRLLAAKVEREVPEGERARVADGFARLVRDIRGALVAGGAHGA